MAADVDSSTDVWPHQCDIDSLMVVLLCIMLLLADMVGAMYTGQY
jgi:hypothetical protein